MASGIDPSFKFSTIETEHFAIHYHQGIEETGKKAAGMAEDIHAFLSKDFLWSPKEKTNLVLIDDTDFAWRDVKTCVSGELKLDMVIVSCLINKFTQSCHSRLSGILILEGERFWTSQNDTTQKCKELLRTGHITLSLNYQTDPTLEIQAIRSKASWPLSPGFRRLRNFRSGATF